MLVNKFARGKSGWEVLPHAGFFREMGGLLYDGVVFTLAGFKVPSASSEGLLTGVEEQTQPGLPQPTGVTNDGKTSTSVNPVEFAALVKSGEIASISKRARLADERCTSLLKKKKGLPRHCHTNGLWQ